MHFPLSNPPSPIESQTLIMNSKHNFNYKHPNEKNRNFQIKTKPHVNADDLTVLTQWKQRVGGKKDCLLEENPKWG